jgi:hypothetical protein
MNQLDPIAVLTAALKARGYSIQRVKRKEQVYWLVKTQGWRYRLYLDEGYYRLEPENSSRVYQRLTGLINQCLF